eukprot:COSAG01_NODE_57785_length_310_cov_0.725118_1_plen_31_part_01
MALTQPGRKAEVVRGVMMSTIIPATWESGRY